MGTVVTKASVAEVLAPATEMYVSANAGESLRIASHAGIAQLVEQPPCKR